MFHATLSLCLLGSALAEAALIGHCPKVQTAQNFNISAYVGRWYEARRYFAAFEIGGKCITADYGLGKNGTISMVNTEFSLITGAPWSIELTGRVPHSDSPAELKVKIARDPIGFETDYWILGTDYETYAVVYNCIDAQLVNIQHAWILTRERNPPQSVIDEALAVAQKNHLRRDKFLRTNQTGC